LYFRNSIWASLSPGLISAGRKKNILIDTKPIEASDLPLNHFIYNYKKRTPEFWQWHILQRVSKLTVVEGLERSLSCICLPGFPQ